MRIDNLRNRVIHAYEKVEDIIILKDHFQRYSSSLSEGHDWLDLVQYGQITIFTGLRRKYSNYIFKDG